MNRFLRTLGLISVVLSIHLSTLEAQSQTFDAEILFVVSDTQGNAVAGTCLFGRPIAFTYEVCDNHDGSSLVPHHAAPDADPAEGTVRLVGHYSGTEVDLVYTITAVPNGYDVLSPASGEIVVQPRPGGSVTYFVTLQVGPGGASPSNSTLQTTCEVVELRPGYPGYRGVVAGLVGRSDTACLSDLQTLDPTFSKATEDAANLQTARALDVGSDPQLWTWEAWMAIGAQRGFGYICFVCLAFAEQPTVPVGPVSPESGYDPRLELSIRELQAIFASRFLSEHGMTYGTRDSDQSLRVHAFSLWDGYPDALQLVETAERLIASYHGGIAGYAELHGGFNYSYPRIVCQSGHAAVPLSANIQDQDGLVVLSVIAMLESNLGSTAEVARTAIRSHLENTYNSWLREGPGNSVRFADFYASAQEISCPP